MGHGYDVRRMGAALAGPGMDTRTWGTLAIVRAVNVTAAGVYFDVTTIEGVDETAVFAPRYGGSGYGEHLPVEVGAMVVIHVPEGDFGAGARVVGIVEDAGDAPSQDAIDNPADIVITVKPEQNYRLIVQG